jgi:hypothetical protein
LKTEIFSAKDIVYTYTSSQAVEDGILFDLDQVQERYFRNSPFSYATTNLLTNGGYLTEGKIDIARLIDLIFASNKIFNKMPKGDWFASGKIELPSGAKQEICISQNETGRYTIMLPQDY